MRTGSVLALASLLSVAVGCGSGDDTTTTIPTPDGGGNVGDNSIQDVQNDAMPVGTPVTLRGVVVVAVDAFGGRQGSVYVMEPGGGPFSGVVLNTAGRAPSVTVGDLVDVEGGVKDEFALNDDTTGRTVTQVGSSQGSFLTVTKTGTGTLPAPEVLNPWSLAADDLEAEKWEGVLIRFDNVQVVRRPDSVSSSDETLREMTVTGPFPVNSALTDLSESIDYNDCYQSVTGIGDYFFSYKILPRIAGDLVGGGTSCLPDEDPQITAGVCDDNLDNDYDGYADCAEFNCYTTCDKASTVIDVQSDDPSVAIDDIVTLSDVVVTAIDRDRDDMWVQDEDDPVDHNGLQIHLFGAVGTIPESVVPGDKVTVTGIKTVFFNTTQLGNAGYTTGVTGGTATVRTVDPDDVSDPSTGSVFEGQLVRVANVTVRDNSIGFGQMTVGSVDKPLTIDDTLFSYGPDGYATSTCHSITGVVLLNSYDELNQFYYVAPRSAADIVPGC